MTHCAVMRSVGSFFFFFFRLLEPPVRVRAKAFPPLFFPCPSFIPSFRSSHLSFVSSPHLLPLFLSSPFRLSFLPFTLHIIPFPFPLYPSSFPSFSPSFSFFTLPNSLPSPLPSLFPLLPFFLPFLPSFPSSFPTQDEAPPPHRLQAAGPSRGMSQGSRTP